MTLRVKMFALARELAGGDVVTVELPDGATLATLRNAIADEYPQLRQILPHAMWAVDAEYATESSLLTEDSDVALIPPVSGG